jgi:diguanylate cyclase (GGDEF)-like protein
MSPHVFEKELPAILGRADNLPSLPAVALEVLRLSEDEDASLDDLASCLSRDPALAAKLLRLANSSLFSTGKAVTTLQRATMLLGMKTVKLMALSFSLAGALPKRGKQGSFDFTAYWHRSLVCAIAARSLARLVKSPQADEAFLCGLLAHYGKLVLTRCLPDEYEAVLVAGRGWPGTSLEEERLGFSSSDVCASLLKSWDLPPLIYVSVGSWSRQDELERVEDPQQKQLARILGLAHLAEQVLCNAEKGVVLARLQHEMKQAFGTPDNEVNALLLGLESGINEAAELLAVQLPSGTSHEEIINQARMQMVQVSLGTALDLAQAQRRNQELESEKTQLVSRANTDKLTGLPNRAAFDAFLEQEIRARAAGPVPRALGLLMIDIDHFKRFNDTHGHQVGDEVLRMVGAVLGRMTRKGDISARYGGEEFAVVIPQTNPFGLKTVADRLREAIEKETLEVDGHALSVTASFGGACIARFESPAEGAALVKLADHYLYRAKRNGRNRCELYPKTEFPGRE